MKYADDNDNKYNNNDNDNYIDNADNDSYIDDDNNDYDENDDNNYSQNVVLSDVYHLQSVGIFHT